MEGQNKARHAVFAGNIEILKTRFPHVIQCLHESQARDPFAAFIREDNGCRQAIHIRRANGCIQPLYNDAALEKLLQRITATQPPEPYDMVFILGVGLGEAGLEAIRQYRKRPRIVIIEPYPSLFKLALQTQALGALLKYDRLSIYLGGQANPQQILEDCKRILPVGRTLLFINPYQRQLTGGKYKQLEIDLVHRIRAARDMWHTTRRFGRQMMMNTIANLPGLLGGTPLRTLRKRFSNVPAICVASGPSLNYALPLLKDIKNALIIACDSAVGNLLQADIQPHFVATADIHASNTEKLRPHMDQLQDMVLVFGVESNPDSVRTHLGPRRVGVTAYSKLVLHWLDPCLDLQCRLPPMTSVTHLAVSLAAAMGANPIVLVGVDLAYLYGQSHARGSVFSHIPEQENLIAVPSVNGRVVYAPPQLVTDRLILEQNIAQHRARTISTSLNGACIRGTQIKSLREVIDTELVGACDVAARLDAIPWGPAGDNQVIVSELRKMIGCFNVFKRDCDHRLAAMQPNPREATGPDAGRHALAVQSGEVLDAKARFREKHGHIISLIEESMLDDLQAIIKQEEIALTTRESQQPEKTIGDPMSVELLYRAYRDSIASLLNQTEKILADIAATPGFRIEEVARWHNCC